MVGQTWIFCQVENHLHDMILKTFDPKKADAIFQEEGETPSWLAELIEYPTWRSLIYRLAEDYPDCLMLNFTIKLISDAGYQVGDYNRLFKDFKDFLESAHTRTPKAPIS